MERRDLQDKMDEDQALRRAIEASYRDWFSKNTDDPLPKFTISSHDSSSQKSQAARDKAMDAAVLRLGVEVDLMATVDADTVVLVGAPPKVKYQTEASYQRILHHYNQNHLVHSQKLLGIGSPKLKKLLSVNKQTRMQRTLKKVLPMGKPPGIKYILDLRPPSEDEEAVLLLTELSCTKGILNWSKAAALLRVSPLMVEGQDDADLLPNFTEVRGISSVSASASKISKNSSKKSETTSVDGATAEDSLGEHPPSENLAGSSECSGGSQQNKTKKDTPRRKLNMDGVMPRPPVFEAESEPETHPSLNKSLDTEESSQGQLPDALLLPYLQSEALLEYSPLRHRSAIERVISAIEHQNPHLDSAPKVWNYFGIAKHLECATHERVNGWITQWLYAFPNSNFIQCNPEICYRVGLGIKSYDLTRTAFSILVGEEALSRVRNRGQPSGRLTIHGRLREHLDDDEQNRVVHAAEYLVARLQRLFRTLIDMEQSFFYDLRHFSVVENFEPESSMQVASLIELIDGLRGYLRGRILAVLNRISHRHSPSHEHPLQNKSTMHEKVFQHIPGCKDFKAVYFSLAPEERIFTRSFWVMMKTENFAQPAFGRIDPTWWSDMSPLTDGLDIMPHDITFRLLKRRVSDFNSMLAWKRYSQGHVGEAIAADLRTPIDSQNSWDSRHPENGHRSSVDGAVDGMENLTVSSPKRSSAILEPTTPAGLKRRKKSQAESYAAHIDDLEEPSTSNAITGALPIRQRSSATDAHIEHDVLAAQIQPSPSPKPWAFGNPDPINREVSLATSSSVEENHDNARDSSVRGGSQTRKGIAGLTVKEEANGDQTHRFSVPGVGWKPPIDTGLDEIDFNLPEFLRDVTLKISNLIDPIVEPAHLWHNNDRLPTGFVDTLVSLEDGEWKYLPLWAGGNDDGTGGVFDESNVPALETGGFCAPGPSIHTGYSISGSSDSNGFSDIGSDAQSTIGKASVKATEGTVSTESVRSINTADEVDFLWEVVRNVPTGTFDFDCTTTDGDIHSVNLSGSKPGMTISDDFDSTEEEGEDFDMDDDDDGDSTEHGSIIINDNGNDDDMYYDDDNDDDDGDTLDDEGFEHLDIDEVQR